PDPPRLPAGAAAIPTNTQVVGAGRCLSGGAARPALAMAEDVRRVAFALKNHIKFAAVKNAAGKYLFPSLRRITAAAAAFPKVPSNNEMHIVNPPKSDPLAYPISTYTYVIVPKQTAHAPELRKMIFWALTQGQQAKCTAPLLFVPLPKPVLVASEKTLKTIHT